MLLPSPSSMRAAATTPAEPADARVARFPAGGSLPRQKGGSASALLVSGPAQRSLALQPAWSLSRPRRPRYIGVLQAMSLPPSPAPIATGWSDSCRAGFAPARRRRLSTAHRRTEATTLPAPGRCPSAHKIARMMTTARNHLSRSGAVTVARIEAAVPALASACALTGRFAAMVRNGKHDNLEGWLTGAESGLLASFARGLRADKAALREPCVNGGVKRDRLAAACSTSSRSPSSHAPSST